MTSIELAKIIKGSDFQAKLSKENNSAVKPYNGVSSLYDGEGRGVVGGPGVKKAGCVTNLANNRF